MKQEAKASAEEDSVRALDPLTYEQIKIAIDKRWSEFQMYKAKKALKAAQECASATVSISSIAWRPCPIEPGYYIPNTTEEVPQQTARKEDAMSDLDTARRHMDTRLYGIKRAKRDALKTQFGLNDMPSPETFADMKARLLAGQFTLPTDEQNDEGRYGVSLGNLEWRDPTVKKDRPGFEAAEKLLDAAAVKVKDAIWVKANAEDALALLEAFESATVN